MILLWAVLPRVLMSVGTLYVVVRLVDLQRKTPRYIQLLEGSDNYVIRAQANTLTRFQEVRYIQLSLLFQAVSLLLLWVGLWVEYGVCNSLSTWVSMTVAAGGVPLIVTKNARLRAEAAQEHIEVRNLVLQTLDTAVSVSMAGILQTVDDNEAAYEAVRTLEKDELIEDTSQIGRWYRLTDTGKSLLMLQGVTKTAGTGIFP